MTNNDHSSASDRAEIRHRNIHKGEIAGAQNATIAATAARIGMRNCPVDLRIASREG